MNKMMIIRTIVMVVALLNQVLVLYGKSPIPYSSEEIEQGLTSLITVLATLWGFWKNNSFTKNAQKADVYLKNLKK